MSHFTVMAVTDEKPTEELLQNLLLPWHEYECTGIEAYLEFVPAEETEEDMRKQFEESKGDFEKPVSFEEFIRGYYGYEKNEQGVYGRTTNPNAKWDWWMIGGRWKDGLLDKQGRRGDICRFGNVDFAKMRKDDVELAGKRYDDAEKKHPKDDATRYFAYGINKGETREAYIARHDVAFSTFGFVLDGQWIEKGSMGWWAMVSDEKETEDWAKICDNVMQRIRPDQWVTIIDCHI